MYYIKKGSFISADGRVEVCEPYCYLKKSFSSFDKAKEELKAIFEENKENPVNNWDYKGVFWESDAQNSFTVSDANGGGVIYKIASA